jgi:YD repeat-containing protein
VTTTYQGDITGMATSVSDGTTTTTVSPANNNAVPDLITTGSLGTDLDWTETLQLSKEEGPNNEAATMEYDSAGRPERSTMADGAVTTYTYSNGMSWPATQTATLAGTDGRYTKTTYDGLGRVKKVEQGNTSGVKTVVEREYTTCACAAAGKLWRVTQPYAPGGTTYWTTYSYDAMGRTVSVAHAGGSGTTTYAYSGNTVTVTDPAGTGRSTGWMCLGTWCG